MSAYLDPEVVDAIDILTLQEKANLESFIKSDYEVRQNLINEASENLEAAYKLFNTRDQITKGHVWKGWQGHATKAKNGYFDGF